MKLINTVSESVVPCLWMSYKPTAREIYPSSANPVIWKVNLPIHNLPIPSKYICMHMNRLYAQPDSIHLRQNWKSVVLTHPPHYPWLYPRVYNWKKLVQPMSVENFQICDISGIFIFQSLIDSVLKTWAFVAAVIAVSLGACPVSSFCAEWQWRHRYLEHPWGLYWTV